MGRALGIVCILGVLTPGGTAWADGTSITLDAPRDGQVVGPSFVVEGRVDGLPRGAIGDFSFESWILVNGMRVSARGGRFRMTCCREEDGPFRIHATWMGISRSTGVETIGEDAVTVTVDALAPVLDIQLPVQPTTRARPGFAKIVGYVTDRHFAELTVDEEPIHVGAGGVFSVPVRVPEQGERAVRIRAVDIVGNVITVTRVLVADSNAPTRYPSTSQASPPSERRKALTRLHVGGRERALGQARAVEAALIETASKVREHAVSLMSVERRIDATHVLASAGSGVVVGLGDRLWILTAEHVIDDALEVLASSVDLDRVSVRIQDQLKRFDVALLALDSSTRASPHPVDGSTRAALPEVGTWVIATGNPFDLCSDGVPAVMRGLVSSTKREIGSILGVSTAIQHDARLNPGCSGGALWDLERNLLGITVRMKEDRHFVGAQRTNVGITLTIPMQQIQPFLGAMMGETTAVPATLGVETVTELDDQGRALGARIVRLDPYGPLGGTKAKRAPRPGDVILHVTIDGKKTRVYTSQDLERELAPLSPGAKVVLHYRRSRTRLSWTATMMRGAR